MGNCLLYLSITGPWKPFYPILGMRKLKFRKLTGFHQVFKDRIKPGPKFGLAHSKGHKLPTILELRIPSEGSPATEKGEIIIRCQTKCTRASPVFNPHHHPNKKNARPRTTQLS
jgi:hypothetical protein